MKLKNPLPLTGRAIIVILVLGFILKVILSRITPDLWWLAIAVTFATVVLAGHLVSKEPYTRGWLAFTAFIAVMAGISVRFY